MCSMMRGLSCIPCRSIRPFEAFPNNSQVLVASYTLVLRVVCYCSILEIIESHNLALNNLS